ncbi:hypothetical protein FH972_025177 [Carpinus fangiana]|uniref:Uncharacterized protein n=1 Tax=Carpinus fangiana TaxID=176857 RepID=A0A5N6L0L2_9ROSI|nr:hypothetical protein FH972_025177 [Carpinus fangiana]
MPAVDNRPVVAFSVDRSRSAMSVLTAQDSPLPSGISLPDRHSSTRGRGTDMDDAGQSTHSLSRLVMRGTEGRQASAWLRKRRGPSRQDSAITQSRRSRRRGLSMAARAWLCAAYGLALVGLLSICKFPLEPPGEGTNKSVIDLALLLLSSSPLSTSVNVVFIIFLICLAILFLHALLRIGMLARGHRHRSGPRLPRHSPGHRTRLPHQHAWHSHHRHHHHSHHARSAGEHQASQSGRQGASRSALQGRPSILIRRPRDRNHRPANLSSRSLYAGRSYWQYPASYCDPDRLPDDDSVYSPTTPMRVHLVTDDDVENEKPTSPSLLPALYFQSGRARGSPLASPASVRASGSPDIDLEAARGVPDESFAATNNIETMAPTAPPPAYGLWRCSVRADPNLLHWVRSPKSPRFSSPLVSPMEDVEASAGMHDGDNGPPSYTFVSAQSSPAEAIPPTQQWSTTNATAPPAFTHPAEAASDSPLASAIRNIMSPAMPQPAYMQAPEMEEVPVALGDWIMPSNVTRPPPRESRLPPGVADEVVLDPGDAVTAGAGAVLREVGMDAQKLGSARRGCGLGERLRLERGTIDAQCGHLLAVREGNLIDAQWIELIVEFGLRGAGADGIGQSLGEVADLADVDGDVGIKGAGCDGKGVPLVGRDGGAVEEEPLAGLVVESLLYKLDLNSIVRVSDDFDNAGGAAAAADFAVEAFAQVDCRADELPTPALVADAVVPEGAAGKRRVGLEGIADEAAGGVGVHGKQERNEEVMGVPKGLIGLLADLGVGGGEHEEHAEEHDMAGDAAGLGVVDLDCSFAADLVALDVEEIHIVRGDMHRGPEEDGVGNLPMEELRLIEGQPAQLGSEPCHDVAAHGQEDEEDVDGEDEACAAGEPYGEVQGIEGCEALVGYLRVPGVERRYKLEAGATGQGTALRRFHWLPPPRPSPIPAQRETELIVVSSLATGQQRSVR